MEKSNKIPVLIFLLLCDQPAQTPGCCAQNRWDDYTQTDRPPLAVFYCFLGTVLCRNVSYPAPATTGSDFAGQVPREVCIFLTLRAPHVRYPYPRRPSSRLLRVLCWQWNGNGSRGFLSANGKRSGRENNGRNQTRN